MLLDSATKARLRVLYPDFRIRLVRLCQDMLEKHAIQLRCTEGVRTFTRQQELFDQGRSKPGKIVTSAKPGQSRHQYGIAADFCRAGKDPYDLPWADFGAIAKSHGLTWGGDWNGNGVQDKNDWDNPHVEIQYGGLSTLELQRLHARGGINAVWAAFDTIRGVPQGSEWYGPQKSCKLLDI